MNSNIQKIVDKLVTQFANSLSKQDKRRLDDYAESLTGKVIHLEAGVVINRDGTPVLPKELYLYVVKSILDNISSGKVEIRDMVVKYLLTNELVKIALTNKATVKLAISYEEFNQLVKYFKNTSVSNETE